MMGQNQRKPAQTSANQRKPAQTSASNRDFSLKTGLGSEAGA
jgi:hypothetical protein